MRTSASTILRVGIGITFVWVGVLIFRNPEAWGGMIRPWAAALLTIPVREAMLATAVLDIAIGLALLAGIRVFWASALGFFHIITVLVTVGIDVVTVRDIAIGSGLLAIMADAWPAGFLSTYWAKKY